MSEKQKDSGALWRRQGQFAEYLSGVIEINGVKHGFKAFSNKYKKTEKQPDFKIFLDQPREQQRVTEDESIGF